MKRLIFATVAALAIALGVGAQAFTTFASGTAITASAMNDNFGALMPIGTIIASLIEPDAGSYMTGSTLWALADGSNPSTGTYNGVFPDLRGQFLRGVDGGSGKDPNAATRTAAPLGSAAGAGSSEADAFQGHSHKWPNPSGTYGIGHDTTGTAPSGGGTAYVSLGAMTVQTDGINGTPRLSTETRPVNIAVYWYIKVK